MMVFKCDRCKRTLEPSRVVRVDAGWQNRVELCADCGRPIIQTLKKYKLFSEEKRM